MRKVSKFNKANIESFLKIKICKKKRNRKPFNRNIAINKKQKMGVSKLNEFSQDQNGIAALAKVLGHPARIAILQHLISAKSCITGNLVEVLPLSQSTISQHLKELKSIGLIKGTIEGTSVCYCINEDVWEQASKMLNQLFDHYRSKNKCC